MKNWRTLTLGMVLCANTAFAAPQVVDKVVAIVDNGVVLESDVDGMMKSVKLNAQQADQPLPDDATLRQQVLERLIMDNVQLQMAKRMGITIPDSELDNAINGIAQQNRMSTQQLIRRLTADGLDYKTYRAQIRKEMLLSEVRNNEVRRRITILPQEVDALTKQISNQNSGETAVNLSHILLPLSENPTQQQVSEAQQQANLLVQQLRQGANFAKLAATYSADPQALKGGEMGWGRLQELPTLFAEALQSAKKGDIVGPIRSGVGFHILRVNDLRGDQANVSVTEVHARHILLRTSPVMSDAQAQAKLEALAAQIKSGQTTFAQAAQENSQDPGSAQKAGDLGWALPSSYDPAFRDALMKLNNGEMSQPVHSSFGWHLIQRVDSRQVDRTDEAQKEQAYRMLFNRKFAEEAQTWLQEQRAAAYVKLLDNNDAKGAQ